MSKINKRKYKIGYKKLKNVNLFEEFTPVTEDTGFGGNFKDEFNSVFYDMNIMHLLFDEGYLDPAGNMKSGLSYADLNDFLEKNAGTKDYFDGDESVEAWVVNSMENFRQFTNKY